MKGMEIGPSLWSMLSFILVMLTHAARRARDRTNLYAFPILIQIAEGMKLALAPLYLGSLYVRLHKCVSNVPRAMGRYDVISHRRTSTSSSDHVGEVLGDSPEIVGVACSGHEEGGTGRRLKEDKNSWYI